MKRLICVALLATCAAAAALFSVGTAGAGAPSPVQRVMEQNVDSQGNIKVHEQGTSQVSLTGSPRVGLDPTLGNTVKFDPNANTVKIDAVGSGPIETQAADNPAQSPVERRGDLQFPDGFNGNGESIDLYTVPSGYELVIEQISVRAGLQSGQQAYAFLYVDSGSGPVIPWTVPLTTVDLASDGTAASAGDIQTRIYADPGSDVSCQVLRSPSSGIANVGCSISGYLVRLK